MPRAAADRGIDDNVSVDRERLDQDIPGAIGTQADSVVSADGCCCAIIEHDVIKNSLQFDRTVVDRTVVGRSQIAEAGICPCCGRAVEVDLLDTDVAGLTYCQTVGFSNVNPVSGTCREYSDLSVDRIDVAVRCVEGVWSTDNPDTIAGSGDVLSTVRIDHRIGPDPQGIGLDVECRSVVVPNVAFGHQADVAVACIN